MQSENKKDSASEQEIEALLHSLQLSYGKLGAMELLEVMVKKVFPGKIALFSSFGADSTLLISMVAEIDKNIPVLFLETGKHFSETLQFVEDMKKHFGLTNLKNIRPDTALLLSVDPNGDLWKTQVNRCCWLRKVEPLERTLREAGYTAVITGRKRYQTPERAMLENVELDENNRFRINPLAYWTKEQFKEELRKRNLPQHPLVSKGYPSIGCEPCTVAVKPGEDERSGRWAHAIDLYGKQKTECGIHLPNSQKENN